MPKNGICFFVLGLGNQIIACMRFGEELCLGPRERDQGKSPPVRQTEVLKG